jgi:hypothetical protein
MVADSSWRRYQRLDGQVRSPRPTSPPEAVAGNVIKISDALTLAKTGALWHFDGPGKFSVCCMSI